MRQADEQWIEGGFYHNRYKNHIIIEVLEIEIQDNGVVLVLTKRTDNKTGESMNKWYSRSDVKHWVFYAVRDNTTSEEE